VRQMPPEAPTCRDRRYRTQVAEIARRYLEEDVMHGPLASGLLVTGLITSAMLLASTIIWRRGSTPRRRREYSGRALRPSPPDGGSQRSRRCGRSIALALRTRLPRRRRASEGWLATRAGGRVIGCQCSVFCECVVGVAVQPALSGFGRGNDRVTDGARVRGRMTVR
jgi:hypothetical protein